MSSLDEVFEPSKRIADLVRPRFYQTESQAQLSDNAQFYYAVDFPEELAGTTLCVRAVLDPPPYGDIRLDRGPTFRNLACINIVAPCSLADSNKAIASHALILTRMRDYERVTNLADSLEKFGRQNPTVLEAAKDAAMKLERYEDALRYIDENFMLFGPRIQYHVNDIPPFNPIPITTKEQAESRYQSERSEIIKAISNQRLK